MHTALDCLPCLIRMGIDASRIATNDPAIQERIIRRACQELAKFPMNVASPPVMGGIIQRIIREETAQVDPYFDLKQRSNQFVLSLQGQLQKQIQASAYPLETAIRLAIAGNIIDFAFIGSEENFQHKLRQTIDMACAFPLDRQVIDQFFLEVRQARRILFLGDNAGEIVCDRLLIEELGRHLDISAITYVTKASPVINDATRHDADMVGLSQLVRVIDNGTATPGTDLLTCSEEFLDEFAAADLIISKGQANYETLNEVVGRRIFFIFMIKCPAVSRHSGLAIGTPAILPHFLTPPDTAIQTGLTASH
jgi:uncharacterized protein with ATP-grasp and redox domains